MQSAEDFMKSFFLARTAEVQSELEARKQFRNKFFAEGCAWDSRRRSVERSESERIVEVSSSDTTAEVITREIDPFPRLRYHLERVRDSWLIQRVDVEFQKGKWRHGNIA